MNEKSNKVESEDKRGRRRWRMKRTLLFIGIVPPITA
jgi:hypothetical protein